MASERLLPCPFCGGEAKTIYIRDGRKAMCQSCHAAGAPEFNGRLDQPSADQRAVTAWNRRAALSQGQDGAVGVKIKPLEWHTQSDTFIVAKVPALRLTYGIAFMGGAWVPQWEGSGYKSDELETIMGAAQADYEARILSALVSHEPRAGSLTIPERQSAWAALRMIADAIGERFGPVASIESKEASLLRGPEYHHFAEGIVEALLRIPSPAQEAGAEPVAWRGKYKTEKRWNYFKEFDPDRDPERYIQEPLYTHAAAPYVAPEGAIADIAAERRRQIEQEGWTLEHDDKHSDGELARAAAAYALSGAMGLTYDLMMSQVIEPDPQTDLSLLHRLWPRQWHRSWWKPKDPQRDLVRAGALIIAEIERRRRATSPNQGGGDG